MPGKCVLFGDSKPFLPPPWQTTDDRVRGGSSQSYLAALPNNGARFYGNLDTKTLGGAGFASQFSPIGGQNCNSTSVVASQEGSTSEGETVWDLSDYDGLQINLGKGDGKTYTMILKDERSDVKRDDGREKAGISWEVEISAEKDGVNVWKTWSDFKAFYRGKEKDDAGKLNRSQIRRIGLMMRRFGPVAQA
ncbi:MAG: hypothetical protein HETSPECPRED_010116 [Heterodermia speciosa]|uniref:NADH:ubiquinone oxidoreductase intermediate-associated protein 30 domain-containing protein n=1 Tax=Heterodermia speciosa TaxID=116794 RepID=A0A8H3EUI4_9LECA|nr:MAG: hypothetical protein HETSPECPRED_010116 [Heterodermia speciosa]